MKPLLMIILLMIFLILGNPHSATTQFSEPGIEKFRVAVEAPDFTLKELGGQKISLKELKGKVIILNFFSPY